VELRARLLKSIAALFVAFGICLYFVNPIMAFLVQPLRTASGLGVN
jgi:sec-independent protein translocase protein TatC